jgi:hypothetical protein
MHDLLRHVARADDAASDPRPVIARLGDYYLGGMLAVRSWPRSSSRCRSSCRNRRPRCPTGPAPDCSPAATAARGATGLLLTQVGMSVPNSAHLIHDFWTTLYQAIDD